MNKKHFLLAAITVLVVILTAACSAPAPAAPTAAPSVPNTAATNPTAEPLATVAPSLQPTTGGNAQAPICQAAATCQALNAEQTPLECVKKVPYTNVLVPPGTQFEVVDKSGSYVCNDSGVAVNGKEVLTCRGTELHSFQLKLTNPSCTGAPLATGTGQCQQGYGYDAAQNCCAPVTGGSGGFAMVTVNLAGCPLPNSTRP
jgi:hypothetical protein